MLSPTVEANHNAAAFILGCYTPTSILPHIRPSPQPKQHSSLKMGWVSESQDYVHITSEHKTQPMVLIWATPLSFTHIHAFSKSITKQTPTYLHPPIIKCPLVKIFRLNKTTFCTPDTYIYELEGFRQKISLPKYWHIWDTK